MTIRVLAATTATAFLLAGCSTVLDGIGTPKSSPAETSAITPAPTGSVESSAVGAATPPPVYGAGAPTAAAAVTPRTSTAAVPITAPPLAAPGGVAYAEPGAQRAQLAGNWTFSWEGGQKSCPVTLTTERGMSAFAAQGDVSCPKDIFMTKSWDVWGNDIVLQNHVGKVTARLRPAGPQRFEGTASSQGEQVALSR